MKEFNVTGICVPQQHYMVDTTKKCDQIIALIKKNKYFTINRARQYGKTTILSTLNQRLKAEYLVIRLSFEGMGEIAFGSDRAFVYNFIQKAGRALEYAGQAQEMIAEWMDFDHYEESYMDAMEYLSQKITNLCKKSEKEIILMIDEVDKSSNNQIFLNFLGMLRNKYLNYQEMLDITFKSVILAGVYDVKNLKLKLRSDEETKYNSPWNIAAEFTVDMSFSPAEIATMLQDYEQDYHTGMDIDEVSRELYFLTGGYPFLVSRLCKWMDEEGNKVWTVENVRNAEKNLLKTRNTLFDDLIKNVENNPELKNLIVSMLYRGKSFSYNLSSAPVDLGVMLGIFCEKNHMLAISNIIFETYLYDYTINLKSMEDIRVVSERSQFVENGRLNMPLVLEKFQELMKSEYRKEDEKFVEQQGRLLFLCFLKPIINGTGFYYVEPETRNNTRMDIVVAFGGEEFICELKIWHGMQYRKEGIRQLERYLEDRGQDEGYLISFSFRKDKAYISGRVEDSSKSIYEIVV